MNEIKITREDGETRGRYVVTIDGIEAELTYSKAGTAGLIADHTGVPEALAGRGVGRALVNALIADARTEGVRIIPLCPFVNAQFQRHPEWADLRG
ncbi:N-acetyltransferase [Paracoccus sp. M683]|uniref:GNAT family N-acetyltransferase n=1 Tax=Paracoccus sp. M683 TaxID=2594268 RepID=UPI00117EA947|nr:GNAT family N-acetyltransferase [Paracoccus sp. M683]TRW98154.1 N-acetyltransferase [Paracoccus sp. M683]